MRINNLRWIVLLGLVAAAVPETKVDHKGLVKLGWSQACQSSTFHDMPLFELMETLHAMDFHHIELAPGEPMSAEHADLKVSHEMSAADVAAILAKLKASHLDVVSYGPIEVGGADEAAVRKAFEFAKKFKAKNLVINEPPADALAGLDKLANEFGVNVAILGSDSPETLLKALEGKSSRLGACADLAAWKRAGLSPTDCVTKLGARVIEVHLSDIDAQGKEVPLGQGSVDAAATLKQLKAQNFKGIFAIHYSSGSGQELLENFAKSVNAFNKIVTEVAGTAP
jgi:sugar phosphate isomerase/epimerase